ncbi:EamA family transporter RarD [Altererythrobacter salegens]|uniref:EamA family transporter RarD n=1 Tax=Croceibacterium salegens TaxID=1737568 RepID=A0A6I4SQW6_9SPHN|nr:EamA family transporter RarD [Croceibacterium salegens]MXO58341.1 EamA family transporter RarD [Croceibacterium salegens]
MSGASTHYDRAGLANAIGAHVFWGSMPLYLQLVHTVPAVEYVAWRILFTIPLCLAIIAWRRAWPEIQVALRDRKTMLTLLASSTLIGVNWFLYVWAIQTGHVYAASLGYYILPLTMMLLGLVVLGEKLTRWQWRAIGLASVGVAILAAGALSTLWLSLSMATTFGLYGLLRKKVKAGPLVGLTLEALILAPLSLALTWWYAQSAAGSALAQGPLVAFAVVMGGPMTAFPLIMFAFAARRLPYTVIGFLQFSSPTIVFLLGLLVFGEDLKPAQLGCFVMIWAAAAVFLWDVFHNARRPKPVAPVA